MCLTSHAPQQRVLRIKLPEVFKGLGLSGSSSPPGKPRDCGMACLCSADRSWLLFVLGFLPDESWQPRHSSDHLVTGYESLLLSQGFILRITGCTGRLSWLCKVPFTPRFADDWSDLQKLNNVVCQLGLLPEPGSVSLVLLFVFHIMDWEYRSAPPGPTHHRNLNRFVNFGHIRHCKGTYACRELQLWWVLWIKMAIWSFISHSGGLYAKHFSRC